MNAAPQRASRIVWHGCANEHEWIHRCVDAIVHAVDRALAATNAGRDVRLLVSGGNTPVPVFRALARAPVDFPRLVVGLVDDRDVEPDADGSNARLVRESLLRERATELRFEVLKEAGQPIDAAVAQANRRWQRDAASSAIAAAVLGLGDDGHTASLFPGAANLDAALATKDAYAAIDASGCEAAGSYPRRISLTPAGLGAARQRILLLRGDRKREVFERALAPGDVRELPIRAAIDLPGAPLHVYWYA